MTNLKVQPYPTDVAVRGADGVGARQRQGSEGGQAAVQVDGLFACARPTAFSD